MRTLGMTMSLAALALSAACSRGSDAKTDDALKNDLALAAQAQPYQAQQFVSPSEQPYGATQQYTTPGTARPAVRDAAIGAAAGAAIGAATGRSVKAGIIGAAAGGILGGIIGNNVDVKQP